MHPRLVPAAALVMALAASAQAEEIGEVGVDWVGNDIKIEAVTDRDIPGVTCYLSYFDRSVIDRLSNGNWFEDPSNSAIDCVATRPIRAADLADVDDNESVFGQRQSIIFKSIRVHRLIDRDRKALIYLSHGSEITRGSAKMAISVVPYGD